MFTEDSTDRVHDHTTLGFRRGCLACAQLEADLARCKRLAHPLPGTAARPVQEPVHK